MIPEFYENTEIFITGGAGTVGRALIEKLLRSCNVRIIYLLLRPKKNLNIEDRLKKMKNAKLFRRLHSEKPNEFDEKICVVAGDVTQPMLGIPSNNAKQFQNVSLVFHCAATVRFDETLRDAITLNVAGTLETLKFAECLKDLKAFVYVSTFFSNPYLKYVEPKMYNSSMDWQFCLDLIKRSDVSEEMLNILTKKLIVGFPNTYCFTKNLAESLVNDFRHKLPVIICRPSIVVFALEEPEPGHASNLFGAMGLFALTGAGILKTLYMKKGLRLDVSPLDICTKAMIYYAAKTPGIYAKGVPAESPVFLLSSAVHSPFSFRLFARMAEKYHIWEKYAFEKNFLIPAIQFTDSRVYYNILLFVKQLLPSVLADGLLRICGRQPELMRLQRKVYVTLETMKPFTVNNYDSPGISCFEDMLKELGGTDFTIDTVNITNNYYVNLGFLHEMIASIREILFKEDPSTLPRSRLIMRFKILLYRMLQIFIAYKLWQKFAPSVTDWLYSGDADINQSIENL